MIFNRYARSETKGNLSKDIKLYCPYKIGEAKLWALISLQIILTS